MLTVKLVEPDRDGRDNHEQIYEAKRVWSGPSSELGGGIRVMAEMSDGETLQFGNYGRLYVMNGQGSTVANYCLGVGDPQTLPPAIAA